MLFPACKEGEEDGEEWPEEEEEELAIIKAKLPSLQDLFIGYDTFLHLGNACGQFSFDL